MNSKIESLYDFKCDVVTYESEKPLVVNYNLYRSGHMEFYKGTKTTSAEFTIVKYGDKFSCFVFSVDDNKKKGTIDEFRGNLLWGLGKPLTKNDMCIRLKSYTNMDEVRKDFDL